MSDGRTVVGGRRLALAAFATRHWPVVSCLALVALGFAYLSRTPVFRVGDGSEYYALFIAWRDTLRPFMTPVGWASYEAFFKSHQVAYLVAPDALRAAFPALISGNTADFNHFWFYGLIPALAGRLVAPLFHADPQTMFLWFHWLLAALPIVLAWRFFQRRGLLATVIVFLLSPVVWYADKVHTEFFTVSTVLCSVIFFRVGRLLPSALFLAIASTQNISLAAIAVIVVGMDLIRRRRRTPYTIGDAIILVLTALAVTVHPAYYFFRLGTVTPQLLAGGAAIGANFRTFYLWFLDPDLGLLPNWPLVVLLFLLTRSKRLAVLPNDARALAAHRSSSGAAWALYAGSYLFFNLFAQSSTQNLNSGATPGLARYALWYLPLFFPLCLDVGATLASCFRRSSSPDVATQAQDNRGRVRNRLVATALIVVLACGCAYSYRYFRPALTEAGAYEPSWSSAVLQRYVPGFYDPPPEVFMERYGTIGENIELSRARAIVGPDCRKLLLLGRDNPLLFGGDACMFSPAKLLAILNETSRPGTSANPKYIRLTDDEAAKARYVVAWNAWQAIEPTGTNKAVLAAGWGTSEQWGVWSSAETAELNFPCDAAKSWPVGIDLALRAFLAPGHERIQARFVVDGRLVEERKFELPNVAEQMVSLQMPESACHAGVMTVTIEIVRPISPTALGLSEDPRLLGVGLSRFRLTTSDEMPGRNPSSY